MAQQDVRYYLNGMLFEMNDTLLRLVAIRWTSPLQWRIFILLFLYQSCIIIIPERELWNFPDCCLRKDVQLEFNHSHIRSTIGNFTFFQAH